MRTMKDIIAGYQGIKLTKTHWLLAFVDDMRILRNQGLHHEARLISSLARQYAADIIGKGC